MSSSDIAISVRGLSKAYTIAHNAARPTTAAEAVIHRLRNPLHRPEKETFWALKDVSFDVHKGEVVGIIGRNGAGKSTLLKILSRITKPTAGRVDLYGRVGSLLEVGTGFHPELTGRENIYLNGAILGMKHNEVRQQFDAIVDFAGVDQFLDTPVKRYSSGMYVRLAFAVAAHLNPEILIVDEVLSVGDAEFQKKCLDKMEHVAINGRTVLLVSHNISSISRLCNIGLYFSQGQIVEAGAIKNVISNYIDYISPSSQTLWNGPIGDDNIQISSTCVSQPGSTHNTLLCEKNIHFNVKLSLLKPILGLVVQFRLTSSDGRLLLLSNFDDTDPCPPVTFAPGDYFFEVIIPADTLAKGVYFSGYWVGIHNVKSIAEGAGTLRFNVDNIDGIGRKYIAAGDHESVIRPRLCWRIDQ